MKRLRHIIFTALAAASALLFVTVAALWIRSYCCIDSITQERMWLYPENVFYNEHIVDEGIVQPGDVTELTVVICSSRGVLRIKRERGADTDPNPPNSTLWRRNPSATTNDPSEAYAAAAVQRTASNASYAPRFGIATNVPFDWSNLRGDWKQGLLWIAIEYRLLAAAFAILPLLWLLNYRRHRRNRLRGHCQCGYNLTGNVSGICPECGAKVAV